MRITLVIIGLLVIVLSVLALVYAFAPVQMQQAQATLAPALFYPP